MQRQIRKSPRTVLWQGQEQSRYQCLTGEVPHIRFWLALLQCSCLTERWDLLLITSKHNQKKPVSLSLSLTIWMKPPLIFIQLSATWASPSTRISLFSNMSPAPAKSAIFNCVDSILSVTTCHKMLSRHWSLLLTCPESITAILYSLAVLSSSFTNFRKFRTMLQDSSVELLSLITYLPSFTLFTGFLLNEELNTNCFSLPLNL